MAVLRKVCGGSSGACVLLLAAVLLLLAGSQGVSAVLGFDNEIAEALLSGGSEGLKVNMKCAEESAYVPINGDDSDDDEADVILDETNSFTEQSDFGSRPPPQRPNSRELIGRPYCLVEKCVVRKDPRSAPSTLQDKDILALMGDPARLHWAVSRTASFSCTDGRNTNEILGTPGGDLGEFLLALSVYEETVGMRLEPKDIAQVMINYLNYSGKKKFRMCTDTQALGALQASVNLNSLNIRNPPNNVRQQLLDGLATVDPKYGATTTGCRHLRAMLESPAEYFVRPELVQGTIRAFFVLMWAGHPKLRLDVLYGKSNEVAVVNVGTGSQCFACGLAPMVSPKTNEQSMIINHADAVQAYREDLATFISRQCKTSSIVVQTFKHRMNVRAGLQFLSTVQRTAMGLPFYTVTFS
eukprot:gnl/Hemi2/1836_TR644_c0_g1_i1.p1 gnl/Hemi2/1836_TR644_c0_g1~~gnl/Hemi2/1836_TR644_c0_g1_i1.p1  ORF type:complete len:412 (+),score=121.59 gnl/Hemi2/1836_TR644_c0_g1_i1:84-1319(+)